MAYAKKNNEDRDPKSKRYPKQCWAAQKENATLSLVNELAIPNGADDNTPFSLAGAFHRFRLNLVDSVKHAGKALEYNISGTDEIAYFLEQYENAKAARREFLYAQNKPETDNEETESTAYTVTFKVGRLTGKTPAQFLLEGGSVDELNRQLDFLEKNLDKYPANAEIMAAIEDAIFLQDTGALTDKKVNKSADGFYELLRSENKASFGQQRDIRVTCFFDRNYPWRFDFTHSMYEETADGKKNYTERRNDSFSLNDQQMAGLIFSMKSNLAAFQSMIYPSMWTTAEALRFKRANEQSDVVEQTVEDVLNALKPQLITTIRNIVNTETKQ